MLFRSGKGENRLSETTTAAVPQTMVPMLVPNPHSGEGVWIGDREIDQVNIQLKVPAESSLKFGF